LITSTTAFNRLPQTGEQAFLVILPDPLKRLLTAHQLVAEPLEQLR
jgi:hypothetical protein